MCMITAPAHVSKTQMLYAFYAVASEQGWTPRVLQTYANTVRTETQQPTYMVLPVPTDHPDQITLHNLSSDDYVSLDKSMQQLRKKFEPPRTNDCFGRTSRFGCFGGVPLRVERSGSYEVTVVPRLADMPRLSPDVKQAIDTDGELAAKLQEYAADCSFLVCRLLNTERAYKPLIYSYTPTRFFIPTKHHHPKEQKDERVGFGGFGVVPPDHEHFDHDILVLGTNAWKPSSPFSSVRFGPHALGQWQQLAGGCAWIARQIRDTIHPQLPTRQSSAALRLQISGHAPNLDLTSSVQRVDRLWADGTTCDHCNKYPAFGQCSYMCLLCPTHLICETCYNAGERCSDGDPTHAAIRVFDQWEYEQMMKGKQKLAAPAPPSVSTPPTLPPGRFGW